MSNDITSKIKLTYYYDALCGWCYGFSPVLSKIEQVYGDRVAIEVISGGLFIRNRVGLINEVAPHIKNGAYKSVEARTGVKFGEAFLKDVFGEGKIVLNSLPPAIALCIVKEMCPGQELKFAELLLKAIYFEGLDSTDIDGLAMYAEKVGCNQEEFKRKLSEDKYRGAAEREFQLFQRSPYSGMPVLVVEKYGQQKLLSNGYTTFEELASSLELFLSA